MRERVADNIAVYILHLEAVSDQEPAPGLAVA